MLVKPPQYDWLINEETSDGSTLSEESAWCSSSESYSEGSKNHLLTPKGASSLVPENRGTGLFANLFSFGSGFGGDSRGEYSQVPASDNGNTEEYWSEDNKILFDNKTNIGTVSNKVEKFLLNAVVIYWKESTIPTDRSNTYYIKKMKCFFFSSEKAEIMKREILEVDNKTHSRLVNFYERQLESCSFPNLIRDLFGFEKRYLK